MPSMVPVGWIEKILIECQISRFGCISRLKLARSTARFAFHYEQKCCQKFLILCKFVGIVSEFDVKP